MLDDPTTHAGIGPATVAIDRPFLIILESPPSNDVGKLIMLDSRISIGRSKDADVVVHDPALSRRHVEIARNNSTYCVRDLQSRNGTRVNGDPIETISLATGDHIQIGATVLQFHDGSARSGDVWLQRSLADCGIAVWEYVADSDELVFSEHVDRALDLPPSTLAHTRVPPRRCIHSDDRERLASALAQEGPIDLEVRIKPTPVLERWVALRGHTGAAGRRAGTLVDVTATKQRELTLSRTALVFASFLDGVALVDANGTVLEINSALAKALAIGRDAAIGQPLFTLVPVADPARLIAAARTTIAEAGRWTTTLHVDTRGAFEVLAFPLRTDRGEEAATAWVFRDVTDRERMAAQIAFLDRLRSLGTLCGGVAHEINNPLMTIAGNMELLREMLTGADAEVLDALDGVVDSATRIAAIVRDLRAFARAEPGSTPQPIDVGAAIAAALGTTGVTVRERAQVTTFLESTRRAHGVEPRLVQVLVNLLLNAAQSIPDGRTGTIAVRTADDRDGIAIEVTDTGAGMPPEVATRVFEPFFTTKPHSGTGLGLSVCHGLVIGMGGTIALSSTEGVGTTARIWLPAAVAAPPDAAPCAPEPAAPRRRVLVIDDEPMCLRTTARLLAAHDVSTAGGFHAAADRLLRDREAYDVIICDLMMPDGSGMDLYARIVAERPELAPRMLFMTGGAFTERAEEFLRTLPSPYLTKPVDRKTLCRAVLAVGGTGPTQR